MKKKDNDKNDDDQGKDKIYSRKRGSTQRNNDVLNYGTYNTPSNTQSLGWMFQALLLQNQLSMLLKLTCSL